MQPSIFFSYLLSTESFAIMSNIFGSTLFGTSTNNNNHNKPNTSIFSSLNTNTATPTAQQGGGGIFGNTTSNNQTGGGLFGASTQNKPQGQSNFGTTLGSGLFGSTQTQASSLGAFGNTSGGGGLFGSSAQTQAPTQNAFGGASSGGGLFGSSAQVQPPQQQQGTFGPRAFGSLNHNPQQSQQQPVQQQGSTLGQSQANRIWTEQDLNPRMYMPNLSKINTHYVIQTGQKSVTDQIELVYAKWDPQNNNHSLFQTYLYNTVDASEAPFYRPDPSENEEKWEEALRKRPNPAAIPFIVKGFEQLGQRIVSQETHLNILHGRLYEINNGLTDLLRKHDLNISTRAQECKKRHLRLSQKCMALATKVQVLRNRGYTLDPAEEELRQKLQILEKSVLDPALNGRGEEIWARMVSVREMTRLLQAEFDKVGKSIMENREEAIDEQTMKKAKKVSRNAIRKL